MGARRRLLYNFENSISTSGQGLITAPVGNGTGKIARRVGTDYSGAVTLVIDAPPTCQAGGGCVPASRVEMLLNYIARTSGKVNKFDETTIMGISYSSTTPVPHRIRRKKYQILCSFSSNGRN